MLLQGPFPDFLLQTIDQKNVEVSAFRGFLCTHKLNHCASFPSLSRGDSASDRNHYDILQSSPHIIYGTRNTVGNGSQTKLLN
jgi:hypothetical protein